MKQNTVLRSLLAAMVALVLTIGYLAVLASASHDADSLYALAQAASAKAGDASL